MHHHKFLPPGPEVQGKYSADLFVQRAQTIFKAQQKARKSGIGADDMKPWFTYLSFQSVHDPLQVSFLYMSVDQFLVQVLSRLNFPS